MRAEPFICALSSSKRELVPFDSSGHRTQSTESADRFGKYLLLLAEGPAHVRSAGRSPVVEHLMGDCDDSATDGELSAELNSVGVAQGPDIGSHEVRAARQDRLESD
jgi:hypothetical protein